MTKCPQCGKDLMECRCVEVAAPAKCPDCGRVPPNCSCIALMAALIYDADNVGMSFEQLSELGFEAVLPYHAQAAMILYGPRGFKH